MITDVYINISKNIDNLNLDCSELDKNILKSALHIIVLDESRTIVKSELCKVISDNYELNVDEVESKLNEIKFKVLHCFDTSKLKEIFRCDDPSGLRIIFFLNDLANWASK